MLQILLLLPVFILVFAALGILVIHRIRPGFGYSWVLAVGASLLVWVVVLIFRWFVPEPFLLLDWYPVQGFGSSLLFQFDDVTWVYAFSLISVLLAVILTVPVRLSNQSSPYTWAGCLAVAGAGLLAILASNPWALVLGWSGIDLIEIVLTLSMVADRRFNIKAVLAFAARILGIMVVLWAMAFSQYQGRELDFRDVSPQAGLILLLAVGFRLGVIPFHLAYSHELPVRQGLGTILRLVAPASSLVVLSRLPNLVMPTQWAIALSGFTALAALYGSTMWLTSTDEISGRPYWLIALAGLSIACVVRGQTAACSAWGVTLLLSGSLLFLYSNRQKRTIILPLLGYLGITGIPFTPTAYGWLGLIVPPFSLLDVIFLLTHFLLLAGYLRHMARTEGQQMGMERWMTVVYQIGLALLIVSQWIIGLGNLNQALPAGVWWGGIVTTTLSLGGFYLYYRFTRARMEQEARLAWLSGPVKQVALAFAAVFRMDWLYTLIFLIYGMVQQVVGFITSILEGDGGFLWSILLMVLLFSLLKTGGIF